jgi:hypothetical protein
MVEGRPSDPKAREEVPGRACPAAAGEGQAVIGAADCAICQKRRKLLFPFLDAQGRKAWVLLCPCCDMVEKMPRAVHKTA